MLTKNDAKMAQGLAIIGMVALHLFCRIDNLPYNVYIVLNNRPFVYYIGLFGDFCIPIYCFCSGYAQQLMYEKDHRIGRGIKRLPKFLFHFWIVVVLFSVIGILCKSPDIPKTINEFLGNIFLYRLSYNGAWWFVLTYVFLILLFPFMRLLLEKLHPIILILVSGMLYVIFYYFEIIHNLNISNLVLAWLWRQCCLLGRTQFPFVMGMIWNKYLIMDKLKNIYNQLKMKRLCLCLILVLTFTFHCFIPSLIVAPMTGMSVLMCFHLFEKPNWIRKLFLFLGRHSTNIWLVHMFFYMTLFKNLIFKLREPILIFFGMMTLCIIVSKFINEIERLVWHLLNGEDRI